MSINSDAVWEVQISTNIAEVKQQIEELQRQLENIQGKKYTIDIDSQKIESASAELQQLINSLSANSGNVNLDNIKTQLDNISKSLGVVGTEASESNTKQIQAWNQLTDAIKQYQEIREKQIYGTATDEEIQNANQLLNIIQTIASSDILNVSQLEVGDKLILQMCDHLNLIEQNITTAKQTVESLIDSASYGYNFSSSDFRSSSIYTTDIANLTSQLESGKITAKEFEKQCTSLINTFVKFSNSGQNIGVVTSSLKEAESVAHEFSQSGIFEGSTIISQGVWKQTANGVSTMTDTIRTADGQVKKLKYTWKDGFTTCADVTTTVTTQATGLSAALQALQAKLKTLITYWTAQFLNPCKILQPIQEAIEAVTDLDTALVDLQKTTTMTTSELEDFYYEANDVAQQMGVTTEEIIEQASAWSRLGYSSQEAATEMATLSSQFASISPGMDTDTAQEGLVSIMKAFDIEVEDVESEIMDKINIIGNNFALTNEDVVTGLEKSASVMAAMGQSFSDTVALFTAGMEVLQNAETMGASLRTIALRVRGYDEETEELSDDLVNITGEVVDLTKTLSNPEGVSLFTDETQTEYKSMVEYLGEIADIWDEISETNQTELLQKLFGKTRANAGAAIITNFDTVREALATMEESAGSADAEMEIIEESIEYKINRLQQIWVGVAQDMVDRGTLGTAIDTLSSLSDAISTLLDTAGLVPVVLGAIATAASKLTGIKLFSITEVDGTKQITTFIDQIKNLNKVVYSTSALESANLMDIDNVDILNTSITELISKYNIEDATLKQLVVDLKTQNATLEEGTTIQAAYKARVDQTTSSTSAATAATKSFSVALSLVKTAGMMLAFTALSYVIQQLVSNITDYINRAETITEAAEEAQSAIDDINDSYQEQAELVAEIAERYGELAEGVNISSNGYENISLTDDDYEEFLEINEQIADLMPGLILTYDDSGNAILNLGQSTQSATEDLYDFLESAEAVANADIADQIEDLFAGVAQTINDSDSTIESLNSQLSEYQEIYEQLQNANNAIDSGGILAIEGSLYNTDDESTYKANLESVMDEFYDWLGEENKDRLKELKNSDFETSTRSGTGRYGVTSFYYDMSLLDEEELSKLKSLMSEQFSEYSAYVGDEIGSIETDLETSALEAETAWSDFLPSMVSTMKSLASYGDLDEDIQSLAVDLVNGIDMSEIDNIDEMGVESYLRNNIIIPLSRLSDESRDEITEAYQELLGLDTDSLDPIEINDYVNSFVNLLEQAFSSLGYNIDLSGFVETLGFGDAAKEAAEYESALEEIKDVVDDTDVDKLEKFIDTQDINTAESVNELQELIEEYDDLEEAMLRYLELVEDFEDAALDLTDDIEELEDMEDKLGQLDTSFAKLFDSDDAISVEDYTEIFDAFSDVEDLDISSFTLQLQEAGQSTEDVRKTIEDLIDAYLDCSGILDGLTEDNAALIAQELEEQGVINAESIVYDALNGQLEATALEKSYLTDAGNSLATAELWEIQEFWDSCEATDAARYYLAQFLLAKIAANGTTINTVDDISMVIALANAALASTEAIAQLVAVQSELESVGGDVTLLSSDSQAILDSITSGTYDYNYQLLNTADYMPDLVSGTNSYSAAQDAATDSTSDATSALEEEQEAIEDLIDDYDDLFDAIAWFYDSQIDDIDDQIDALEDANDELEDQIDTYGDILDAVDAVYEAEISELEDVLDGIEELNDALQDQLDIYDAILEVIENVYNTEIDGIELQIDTLEDASDALQDQLDTYDGILAVIESVYDDEIAAIQEKIDALDDANDAAEKQLALEEAQYALEQARNNKTILQYTADRGYIYTVDESAIKEAEEEVDTANAELIKAELEEQIELLEEMKELWSEIPDAFEDAMNEAATIAQFGADYVSYILGSTADDVESFKALYVAAQTEMAENEELVESLEEQIETLESMIDLWSEVTSAYEDYVNSLYAIEYFGTDYISAILSSTEDDIESFKNAYISAQAEMEANESLADSIQEQIDALEEMQEKWSEVSSAYEDAMNQIAAAAQFGSDYVDYILNSSETDVESFKNTYIAAQTEMAENDSLIASLEDQKAALEELKEAWEDAENAYQESQYEAALSAFFGSDYEYELLNNSGAWVEILKEKYLDAYAQLDDVTAQIESASESASSSTSSVAGSVSGLSDALGSVGTISDYIWTDEDEIALDTAQSKLEYLEQRIDEGNVSYMGAANALSNYVDKFEGLKEGTATVEEVNEAFANLESYNDRLGTSFMSVLETVNTRINELAETTDAITESADEAIEGATTQVEVYANTYAELGTAAAEAKEGLDALDETVDEDVEETAVDVNEVAESIGLLNESFATLDTNVSGLSEDANTVITVTQTAVETTQSMLDTVDSTITSLKTAITNLETSLTDLNEKLSELDAYTFSNVISYIGLGDGSEGSLYAAITSVIELIAGDGGLIEKLTALNTETSLDLVTAEFNGDESLLTSVQDVINLIVAGADATLTSVIETFDSETSLENIIAEFNGDESLLQSIQDVIDIIENADGLIAIIDSITGTISSINQVDSGFDTLMSTVTECNSQVDELKNAIDKLEDKTITITTVYETVGSSTAEGTGTAKTFGTGTAKTGRSYAGGTGKWALPANIDDALISELGPELLLRDGRYHLITEPTLIDLKKDDVIFNAAQTAAIMQYGGKSAVNNFDKQSQAVTSSGRIDKVFDSLSFLSSNAVFDEEKFKRFLSGKTFAAGTVDGLWDVASTLSNLTNGINIPNADTINNSDSVVQYVFNGDLSFPNITSGNDAQKLVKELQNLPSAARQYAAKRN